MPASVQLSASLPEVLPALLVIGLAAGLRSSGKPFLAPRELAEGVDLNIVGLLGGGIALGLGLEASGFASWLAGGIAPGSGWLAGSWGIFALSTLIGFVLTFAASNTAAAVVACPIAATIAIGARVDPVPPIIGAALACSISSSLPSTTPPMAIVYSSGHVRVWDMLRVGIVSDILRLSLLVVSGPIFTMLL
jgi:sodium-dependent dicarboxylate transporter 2/3/5